MNEIVNQLLLAGNKFMAEKRFMHLKQPGFICSACGTFTKNNWTQKFKETGDARHIYKNELDKVYFQYGMAYEDFKDIAKRTASDKVLGYKVFKTPRLHAKTPNYDGYQRGLASIIKKSYDEETSGIVIAMLQNEQLAEEAHTLIINKFF